MERTLKQELQGKDTSSKRAKGEFHNHALLHNQAILLFPHFPLHLLLLIIIHLFLLLILLLLLHLLCRDL